MSVLGWQNGRESFEDISATVDAIDVALDVGVIYCGLDKGFQHRLVSVVSLYPLVLGAICDNCGFTTSMKKSSLILSVLAFMLKAAGF